MTYIQGFIVAVPTANRQAYHDHADAAVPLFKEFGADRMVEGWGDDVPDGKVNDFKGAVLAQDDETVLFSWIEYADRATCDAAGAKMMSDPRMEALGAMPFDGKRMVWGGFDAILDIGPGGATGYIDGFVIPVAPDRKDAYVDMARAAAPVFLDHGATRVVEGWGDNIVDGKVTDFRRATHARDGENIVFAWVEWPSKAARDAGSAKVMADERMKMPPADLPFDATRAITGGFAPLLDK
jgi:uncharacterized protein YbaA (DUF1428 family)